MIFIDACKRLETPYTPIWMMRQAGRYLEEYRATRAKAGSFLDLCQDVTLATEVTLQPVEILNVDAAILFSDILLIPLEMGLPLEFIAGEGPRFQKSIESYSDVCALKKDAFERLDYVYDTISSVRARLPQDKALIGFCGAPWTLATYMIEGEGSKTYTKSKKMLYANPQTMHYLLKQITDELKGYLTKQIQAGANAVMIFDSWANALAKDAYFEFSWGYMKDIAKHVKMHHPDIPVILFPKGVAGYLKHIDGDFDVFGVDWSTPLELAKTLLGKKYVLQGNLEPCCLYHEDAMEMGVDEILAVMGKKPGHIFNLGHGMLPDLPRENAIKLVELIHQKTKR
ncbi:uroporphyrinogen decarboxylase [Helicobacter mustelae]|uniref:Uroporphyrinogen decarboxylase n=1 Tax=Helicobacter mustelae (strain ATCC 43772 / CCUG 25715 / CIP 103759 / LMG 18044 / NCTC 12198 / R85-136P) TaxID=679897 RepID=D3UHW4_HELM1|nr:uroporphyrinogen decarboxylase [Helicobacter mustelae]CBG40087.1 uroporphyrinogen decarboxylase [Helicobacter mustelae 12198]SQH71601.1 uroporphyrinogen decarboxylase [Helicobacter mustelae]STP12726.1 uroporphyrinogen decarboxylase [Helicobacter mustelae]STP14193.1 uroporphyrinogen decarboxylase [Helicobacter mustelae]